MTFFNVPIVSLEKYKWTKKDAIYLQNTFQYRDHTYVNLRILWDTYVFLKYHWKK